MNEPGLTVGAVDYHGVSYGKVLRLSRDRLYERQLQLKREMEARSYTLDSLDAAFEAWMLHRARRVARWYRPRIERRTAGLVLPESAIRFTAYDHWDDYGVFVRLKIRFDGWEEVFDPRHRAILTGVDPGAERWRYRLGYAVA